MSRDIPREVHFISREIPKEVSAMLREISRGSNHFKGHTQRGSRHFKGNTQRGTPVQATSWELAREFQSSSEYDSGEAREAISKDMQSYRPC